MKEKNVQKENKFKKRNKAQTKSKTQTKRQNTNKKQNAKKKKKQNANKGSSSGFLQYWQWPDIEVDIAADANMLDRGRGEAISHGRRERVSLRCSTKWVSGFLYFWRHLSHRLHYRVREQLTDEPARTLRDFWRLLRMTALCPVQTLNLT